MQNTIYALAKDEKRFSAQERRDRSEKPGTSDEERETSEDLQRIARTSVAKRNIAHRQSLLTTHLSLYL